jgi:RimJ/RimL family protein N-acetyltransferase
MSGQPYISLPSRPNVDTVFLTALYTTDAEALCSALDIPAINDRLISVPKPYRLTDATSWIALQQSGTSCLSLQAIRVGEPEMGRLIGCVSLLPPEPPSVHAEFETAHTPGYKLGYWIHPDFHRQGIMRDAVLAAITWATHEQGVRVILVSATADNPASWKLIDSLEEFVRGDEELDIDWPECKGGGKKKDLTWQYTYTGSD